MLSAAALATSVYLALQHRSEQRRANLLPYYTRLFDELRTLEFHDHYAYLCTRLQAEHDPQLGISGLPDDARRALYHVAYLFQGIGMLWLLDIVGDQVMATIDVRVVQVWDAIAPYVEREREINSTAGAYLMRTLEELAADVRRLTARFTVVGPAAEGVRGCWVNPWGWGAPAGSRRRCARPA